MGDLNIIQQKLPSSDELYNKGKAEIKDLRELKVGEGSSVFYTDKEGSRWGHIQFEQAQAYIKINGEAKFKTAGGQILLSTNASDGNFVNVINSAFNTSSKTILGSFTFSTADYQGAFKTGNITWNESTGAITGGSGSVYNSKGLVFATNGVPTITLDGVTGDATFKGTVAAGSVISANINADLINAGTLTGRTIQSSAGNERIVLNNGNILEFFYGGVRQGYVRAEASGNLRISAEDNVDFRAAGTIRCTVTTSSFRPNTDRAYDLGTDANQWRNVYGERFYAGASGTGGFVGPSTYGFLTALQLSGSAGRVDMDGKYRTITVIGGIITDVSAETGWTFLDGASGI